MVTTESRAAIVDEAELLGRARSGDAEAFGALGHAHEARLYRQAFALARCPRTAEELVVETLVEAWRSLSRYHGTCRFSTWLYAILLHRHQKAQRRERGFWSRFVAPSAADEGDPLASVPDPRPLPADAATQIDHDRLLQAALAALPEKHRQVLLLRFYESAALHEIAAALDISVGTVKSRLHHALEKLRQRPELVNLFSEGRDP